MITPEALRISSPFAALPQHELASIAAHAADVRMSPGDWLIQEGEVASFFVLLEGQLAVMKSRGGVDEQINAYQPGDFFGELPLVLGSPAVASLRALEASRVARLDERDFRELIVSCDALSGAVMRAMTRRVGNLQRLGLEPPSTAVTVVGRRSDLACHDVRDFLARNAVADTWLDPADPAAGRLMSTDEPASPLAKQADEAELLRNHG